MTRSCDSDLETINPEFESHYRSHFGERWTTLVRALRAPARKVAYPNPHHPEPRSVLPDAMTTSETWSGCLSLNSVSEDDLAPREAELRPYYRLDGASVGAARTLGVQSGDRVLDMCAAPGGKTLVLSGEMEEDGFLVANDRSSSRRARLHDVLEAYLPDSMRRRVRVTGHDARQWGLHQQGLYDRVLVDAPCSGERHLLEDSERLRTWSSGRPKQMAHRQYPMLCAALDAVRVGGRVVYCTCALLPTENDDVLERLLERSGERLTILDLQLPVGEPTTYGWQIYPDTADGWGPMFVSGFEREA